MAVNTPTTQVRTPTRPRPSWSEQPITSVPVKASVLWNLNTPDRWSEPGGRLSITSLPRRPAGWLKRLVNFVKSFRYDYVALEYDLRTLLLYVLLKRIFPFHRARLVSVGAILPSLDPGIRNPILRIKRNLLRGIDLHLVHARDTKGMERAYGIPKDRIRYVPFRTGGFEKEFDRPAGDDGYVFTGGLTYRDYRTFTEAIRGLDVPVKMFAGPPELLEHHSSQLDVDALPANVEFHDGFDPAHFRDTMAHARLVVVPLCVGLLWPAGLTTILDALAYRKCVIVTESPSVRGLLARDEISVVPAGNSEALRRSIELLWNSPHERQEIAARGYRRARQAAEQPKIYESVAAALSNHWQEVGGGKDLSKLSLSSPVP